MQGADDAGLSGEAAVVGEEEREIAQSYFVGARGEQGGRLQCGEDAEGEFHRGARGSVDSDVDGGAGLNWLECSGRNRLGFRLIQPGGVTRLIVLDFFRRRPSPAYWVL